jgi:hypothetical protein
MPMIPIRTDLIAPDYHPAAKGLSSALFARSRFLEDFLVPIK